jgi:iron-sulfur cluster repair protein YtfE (RIC family)
MNSRLIEELKQDHIVIKEVVEKIGRVGIFSDEGQKTLLISKSELLKHLEREDKELYPVLYREAESNETLKQTLNLFASEMDKISQAAMEFFEKYSHKDTGLDFAKDFGRLTAMLTTRIRREENIIYREYDKLMETK